MSFLYNIQSKIAKVLKVDNSELSMYVNHFRLPNPETKRILIFAQGRSGSTLLENLLASTGYFKELGELFAPERLVERKFPFLFLSGLSKITGNISCHVKIYHLTRDRKKKVNPERFLKKLQKEGWFIIFLNRKDKFQQALSNQIAIKRNNYHKVDDSIEDKFELIVDCTELKRGIKQRLEWYHEEKKILRKIPHLYIDYENDLKNSEVHQQTVEKILEYIDLPKRRCFTKYKKINKFKPEEIIINYHEVRDLLLGLDYIGKEF